jgi:hypothetical protein
MLIQRAALLNQAEKVNDILLECEELIKICVQSIRTQKASARNKHLLRSTFDVHLLSKERRKKKMKITGAVVLAFLIAATGFFGAPRVEASPEDFGMNSYEEALRADLRAKHAEVIGKAMRLSGKEAEAFWAIFGDYQKDLKKLYDERMNLLKDYYRTYDNLTAEKAYELAERVLDYEAGRVKLKRHYFKKFSKALSPQTALKFFQMESQIQALVDLQIASELPLVK